MTAILRGTDEGQTELFSVVELSPESEEHHDLAADRARCSDRRTDYHGENRTPSCAPDGLPDRGAGKRPPATPPKANAGERAGR